MRNFVKEARITQLKAMHKLMCNANDESIYMTWITCGMPDEPTEDDFEFIAEDDESYTDAFDLFARLIVRKGNRW